MYDDDKCDTKSNVISPMKSKSFKKNYSIGRSTTECAEDDEEVLKEPKWLMNDLCRVPEDECSEAVIYRVIDIQDNDWDEPTLTLKPVHGIVCDINNVTCKVINSEYCKRMTLVDVANEYAKLGSFIADEAKRRNIEPPQRQTIERALPIETGGSEEVRAGHDDPGVEHTRPDVEDDCGLCTDISSRDELP